MKIRDIASQVAVIPVLTVVDIDDAVPLARALVAGGLHVIEVTLRSATALDAVAAMRSALPEAIIGVGTLTRPFDFAAADRAGAQFGVSPGLTPELAAASRGSRFPLLPGVMTATEVMIARNAGYEVLKFFPAQQAGGVALLQALLGPFPEVLFCPTGGITAMNAPDYLGLPNVLCVGGTWMVPQAVVAARDWAAVEALARDAAMLAHARGIDRSRPTPVKT